MGGQLVDVTNGRISGASVKAVDLRTSFVVRELSGQDGTFHLTLPVGEYELIIEAKGFAPLQLEHIRIDVDRTIYLPLRLAVATASSEVEVVTNSPDEVDVNTALGNVVSSREAIDLPLNGRNLTQLGLLQPGVAGMTAGLSEAGGILRSGQAYAVNGQRPESNNYLLDGVSNVDAVNGGFAVRVPVDSVAEFRILTSNAPPEYGNSSGAQTTVITKSGSNQFHGDLYDFFRNNAFDSRNFFAAATEPLHQNQFGATIGGPLRKDRDFFFAFYEGQRARQGETHAAIVPTAAQRAGNFSGIINPATGQPVPLINELTGAEFPHDTIPAPLLNPIALQAQKLLPPGNIAPNLFSSTEIAANNYDQGGLKYDHNFQNGDQVSMRYSAFSFSNFDPLPINGASVPGFPIATNITTNSFTLSHVHLFSPETVETVRAAFFRNAFDYEEAQNHTPGSSLGFAYSPTLGLNAGTPFLQISGYSELGNPITGPKKSYQNDYQLYYSLGLSRGGHSIKVGGQLDRQQINAIVGIATNGFFVFAPFPASDAYASFLLGQPVVFYQAGGDFGRGLRKWIGAGYAQDDWRVTPRLTLNYGLRYEVNTPYTEVRNRINAFVPGSHSTVNSSAPTGLLFPGDRGIPSGIAPVDWGELMPRIGLAYNADESGHTVVRAAYGVFYDGFTNGQGGPLQAAPSSIPWTQAFQLPGPGIHFADPFNGQPTPFAAQQFVRPATVLTLQSGAQPPYAQNWNLSIEHSFGNSYLLDIRYVGNKGTHLPRLIEANPAIYGPGATSQNADQRRPFADCNAQGSCAFASVGLIADSASSTYHAFQVALTRRFAHNLGFLASYTFSKSLDYVSSFNLAGSAPTLVAGENDLAQNPFNLRAEHGPSLFDARQRFILSGTYAFPGWKNGFRPLGLLLDGWQLNLIASLSSGTPFTVYDSANVSLQGDAPEITGFPSSRPNLIGDPNAGSHTPNQWVSRSAFQQLDPQTQAGEFGNEGRNAVRGPGIETVDVSLFKNFQMSERSRLQFRAECFNCFNHANFGLPENDIESPAFGQILQAGPPRLLQLALKFYF